MKRLKNKKHSLTFILFLVFFSLPSFASAHIAGQPPFFLMNDKYADFYPVYTTSLPNFTLPQDIAPETYVVNEEIVMEIETEILPFPSEITEQITFTWDFGDGQKASGINNVHRYQNPGTYLLTIQADYNGYEDEYTQPTLQAVVIHIKSHEAFKLPQAVISVNGKNISDPLTDVLSFPKGTALTFSAKNSLPGDSSFSEYIWDMGDGIEKKGDTVTYTPSQDKTYIFPFLRIKTSDGYFSDTYVQIENVSEETSSKEKPSLFPFFLGGNIIILIIVGYIILRKKPHSRIKK